MYTTFISSYPATMENGSPEANIPVRRSPPSAPRHRGRAPVFHEIESGVRRRLEFDAFVPVTPPREPGNNIVIQPPEIVQAPRNTGDQSHTASIRKSLENEFNMADSRKSKHPR